MCKSNVLGIVKGWRIFAVELSFEDMSWPKHHVQLDIKDVAGIPDNHL